MSECIWNYALDEEWNVFDQLWFDVIPCIKEIQGQIIQGAPPEVAYAKAVKKDKKLHCKIVRLILRLKGEEITEEKEVCLDKYKVTASDIELLINEYHRRENISIMIDDITIG